MRWETLSLYLGKPFSKAPGHFPLLLVVKFITQQKHWNTVPDSFLQNR